MEQKSYLIFSLNGARYGVETDAVQEIFFLPFLTPIDEAPRDIVGIVNLRGEILPVMDLDLRFGRRVSGSLAGETREYKLSDSVVVLEWEKFQVGIVVNQVHEVQEIGLDAIATQLSYGRQVPSYSHHFVAGVAKLEAGIVMLLHTENLIQHSESVASAIANGLTKDIPSDDSEATALAESVVTENRKFCPHASSEERAIFQERAENLMRPTDRQDFAGLMALAVVGLNGEYFGLDLNVVREFTDIQQITPIPCCPPHIVGNINLRGEIVTLVDIRGLLNMPISSTNEASKAMVVHIDDIVAGLTIDEVCDVMYLHPSQLTPLPAAVHSAKDEYLRGTAPYGEKMMSLLDIPKIMTQGELVVNEEV